MLQEIPYTLTPKRHETAVYITTKKGTQEIPCDVEVEVGGSQGHYWVELKQVYICCDEYPKLYNTKLISKNPTPIRKILQPIANAIIHEIKNDKQFNDYRIDEYQQEEMNFRYMTSREFYGC